MMTVAQLAEAIYVITNPYGFRKSYVDLCYRVLKSRNLLEKI